MIDKALSFLESELQNYATSRGMLLSSSNPFALAGNISQVSDLTGETPEVLITVVNIEEDRVAKSQEPYFRQDDKIYKGNPRIPVNIYCLFSAINSASNYSSSLAAISHVISFFQGKNVFTPADSDLDDGIEKLIADLYAVSFDQLNLIWGYNGAKYYPSVIYKMRMVIIDDGYRGTAGVITEVDLTDQKV